MKITIIQGAFLPIPPVHGGAVEKLWFGLAKQFAKSGHEVNYISKKHSDFPESECQDGILHQRVLGYNTPKSSLKLKLLDLLYSRRAVKHVPSNTDIIVTNTFWSPLLVRRNQRRRVYVSVERMPKGQMFLYKKVGRLRANSNVVADAIKRELPTNLHHLVSMIPNFVPFDTTRCELTEKKMTFLYCGRIHPEKGVHLLVEAFRQFKTDWELRIVGPSETKYGGGGPAYLESLKSAAHECNVTFTGPIFDEAKLYDEYRKALVFVYPSLAEKGETFGLAPLEAMAWGCVPIVSSLECFSDFIITGKNGLVFDHRGDDPSGELSKAMHSMILDREFIQQMSAAARLVNESHSAEKIASNFMEDFTSLRESNW